MLKFELFFKIKKPEPRKEKPERKVEKVEVEVFKKGKRRTALELIKKQIKVREEEAVQIQVQVEFKVIKQQINFSY